VTSWHCSSAAQWQSGQRSTLGIDNQMASRGGRSALSLLLMLLAQSALDIGQLLAVATQSGGQGSHFLDVHLQLGT